MTSPYGDSINIFTLNVQSENNSHVNAKRLCSALEVTSYICATFVLVSFFFMHSKYNEPIYTFETDYLKWVTPLPAYTVCPEVNSAYIFKQLSRYVNPNSDQLMDFVIGLISPSEGYCRYCSSSEAINFPPDDYEKLTEILSQPCEALLINCTWNDKPFQCCQHFQKIFTKRGVCFSLHSAHANDTSSVPAAMVTSHQHPKAVVKLEMTAPANIYIHDRRDLAFYKPNNSIIQPGYQGEILYKFTEVVEDPSSWSLDLSQRNCVLTGEMTVSRFNVYSQSACRLRCLARLQTRLCNCKHHLLPGLKSERDCDLRGLMCLDQYFGRNRSKHMRKKRRCRCFPDCSFMVVGYVQYSIEKSPTKTAVVKVTLAGPPTERVKMSSKVTFLDIIVILACLSRLVTNATWHGMIVQAYRSIRKLFSLLFDGK